MAEMIDGAGTPAHIFYLVRSIESLAAFGLVDHYIRSDKLIQIMHGDVEAHAWALINKKPVWKRMATHDRVKDMFRNFDVSANGTTIRRISTKTSTRSKSGTPAANAGRRRRQPETATTAAEIL